EPFHTTKPQGTGLGLATVHKILENHDARIFVESELGKGTEFTVEFSRLADPGISAQVKRGNG
ncbi:MAG TPA: ATP-binding protein, partial [Bdellovibrionales bacterium]|nr:ATP-binding protein [Bdellovibrionales bacterium]